MTLRIDLTEPKRLLSLAESALDADPAEALALATMAQVAYTIAAAEAGMRAVDEMLAEDAKDRAMLEADAALRTMSRKP